LNVLQVVYEIAACLWRDSIPSDDQPHSNPFLCQEIDKDQKKRGLIASILLRACYGGMKGDVRFLRAFANTWHRRFQHQPDAWQALLKKAYADFKGNEVRVYYYSREDQQYDIPLLHEDQLKEAVDMHCYPQIIDQLMGRSEILRKGVTRAQIKEAIWFHRSGINLKKPVCSCGLIHNDAAREMHTNTMEQSSCPPPKDSFAEAALDLKPVWEIIEADLNEIVKKGTFWRPSRATQMNPKKTSTRQQAIRSGGLGQPTLEFFQKRLPDPTAVLTSPKLSPSTGKRKRSAGGGNKKSHLLFHICGK